MAITESRVLPPQFIEDLATDFGKQLTAQTAVPMIHLNLHHQLQLKIHYKHKQLH